jgi:hypothetical protein
LPIAFVSTLLSIPYQGIELVAWSVGIELVVWRGREEQIEAAEAKGDSVTKDFFPVVGKEKSSDYPLIGSAWVKG